MNDSKDGGLSNLPQNIGRQECPPSDRFLDPFSPIDQHQHRLPHWQQGAVYYFVTWRLADSLPREKLERWNEDRAVWNRLHPRPWDEETEFEYHKKFSAAMDNWLDAGQLGKDGRLWQPDYWDRLIRNEGHWLKCLEYIQENPIKAQLTQNQYRLFVREKERGFSNPQS